MYRGLETQMYLDPLSPPFPTQYLTIVPTRNMLVMVPALQLVLVLLWLLLLLLLLLLSAERCNGGNSLVLKNCQ